MQIELLYADIRAQLPGILHPYSTFQTLKSTCRSEWPKALPAKAKATRCPPTVLTANYEKEEIHSTAAKCPL